MKSLSCQGEWIALQDAILRAIDGRSVTFPLLRQVASRRGLGKYADFAGYDGGLQ